MTTTRPTIDDAEQFMNRLRGIEHQQPDGERVPTEVEGNRADDRDPNLLRVKVPRKSTQIPRIIEQAYDRGLVVGDVWQHDVNHDSETVYFKLVPEEVMEDDD